MSDDPSNSSEDASAASGRDLGQVVLAAFFAVALITAATLLSTVPEAAPLSGVDKNGLGDRFQGGSGPQSGSNVQQQASTTKGQGQGQNQDQGQNGGSGDGGGASALGLSQQTGIGGSKALTSLSPEVHMVVISPTPAKWRTGAYTTYTGDSWVRPDRKAPYETAGVIDIGMTRPDRRVDHRVKLKRPAGALPAAWKPDELLFSGDSRVYSSATAALLVPDGAPRGTVYGVRSYRPITDPEVLRQAATRYPHGVEAVYTQLPENTPDRLRRRTDEIVRGSETAYDKARAIERWLESTKEYSLNSSHPSDVEHVVDHFVFEMETGYCQYFAGAMTVMLRTQGIPARYVVGYATGDPVGNDTYVVRGMHAHAWVEVYFPEIGWVPFDPTPSGPRIQNEQSALANASPEVFSLPKQYTLELNRTPTPGAAVTATVKRKYEPAAEVTVLFNDKPVGTTDQNGTTTARIPYTKNLTVSIANGSLTRRSVLGAPPDLGGIDRRYRLRAPRPRSAGPRTQPGVEAKSQSNNSNVSRQYALPTNVSFEVENDPIPGESVTVRVAVADVPMRRARVTVDGRRMGRTDTKGTIEVTLPETADETVTITAQRGEIRGETSVRIGAVRVSAVPESIVALPGQPARVTVTAGGTPVDGARVRVDGHPVGETTNGTLVVELPFADDASISATARGQTATTRLSGLIRNLALLLGGLVALVLAVEGIARWYGTSLVGLATHLVRAAESVGRTFVNQVVRIALATVALMGRIREWLLDLLSEGRNAIFKLRSQLATAVTAVSIGAMLAWIRGFFDRLQAFAETAGDHRRDRNVRADHGTSADGTPSAGVSSIRETWWELVAIVSPPRVRTKTPGEIARYAVRMGFPERPVYALRDAFRDAEYGEIEPSSDRIDRVRDAIETIRRTATGGSKSGSSTDSTPEEST